MGMPGTGGGDTDQLFGHHDGGLSDPHGRQAGEIPPEAVTLKMYGLELCLES